MKRVKSETKYKLWEKIFIFISSLVIIIIASIYMYRLVYYYKIEHPKLEDKTLARHIIKKGTTNSSDGLYTFDSNNYYYQGVNVNNYLWFSGRLFRIVSIDDEGLTLITEDSQSTLVWGITNEFRDSYVYKWLNVTESDNTGIFLKSITNYETNLISSSWCSGINKLEKDSCTSKVDSYVSLLSVSDYLRAGGKNSYLNNNTYWWTSNISESGNAWYVHNNGGINDEVGNDSTYYSYGIRPVIKLARHLDYLEGDGTLDNPYQVVLSKGEGLIDKDIGEYIKFNNYTWRIQAKNIDSVKLILESEDEELKYTEVDNYLEKNKDKYFPYEKLVKCDYFNGIYNKDTNYDYLNIYSSKDNKDIGLPSIGELFINDYANVWLSNSYGENSLQYKTKDLNNIIADDSNNKALVRPVVCLGNMNKIISGKGTKNDPYLLEE